MMTSAVRDKGEFYLPCRRVIFPDFEEGGRLEEKDPAEAEKMVLILFAIGDSERSLRKLQAGGASFLTKKAFENPDPRDFEASTSTEAGTKT